jgi:16S rRNA (guanine527-N7)-methyltransferase
VLLLYERIPTLALISKNDRGTLYTRHILDSLNLLSLFPAPPECSLDIGSGGGLPGIPLAIAWPGARVVLLEGREKKAAFLERTARALGLRNVRVACERLEEHAKKGMPVYDALFIRAVAEFPRMIDEVSPSCRPGARWVYFAGGGIDREKLAADLAATGRSGTEALGRFGGRLLHGLV